jgi:hypothetical protein
MPYRGLIDPGPGPSPNIGESTAGRRLINSRTSVAIPPDWPGSGPGNVFVIDRSSVQVRSSAPVFRPLPRQFSLYGPAVQEESTWAARRPVCVPASAGSCPTVLGNVAKTWQSYPSRRSLVSTRSRAAPRRRCSRWLATSLRPGAEKAALRQRGGRARAPRRAAQAPALARTGSCSRTRRECGNVRPGCHPCGRTCSARMRMTVTSRPLVQQARVGRRRPAASSQIGGVIRMGGSLLSRVFTRIRYRADGAGARRDSRPAATSSPPIDPYPFRSRSA